MQPAPALQNLLLLLIAFIVSQEWPYDCCSYMNISSKASGREQTACNKRHSAHVDATSGCVCMQPAPALQNLLLLLIAFIVSQEWPYDCCSIQESAVRPQADSTQLAMRDTLHMWMQSVAVSACNQGLHFIICCCCLFAVIVSHEWPYDCCSYTSISSKASGR